MSKFTSSKRAKAVTVAVAGTMALATAISVATSFASSATPIPATADAAFLPTVNSQDAVQAARPAGLQQAVVVDNVASLQLDRHAQRAAAAKITAAKDAADARKAAAEKAAAARKAAAEKAAERAAAARKAAAAKQAAVIKPSGSPEQIAKQLLSKYGWSQGQFSCLQPLWFHESGWNVYAENPSSGAYGIPQALPGSQMASAGADWRTNAATQIKWGLNYIHDRYGSPCGAWSHEQADNWY